MKRDMDLIRNLLLYLEDNSESNKAISLDMGKFSEFADSIVSEHLRLIKKSGHLDDLTLAAGGYILAGGITPQGYDFLDSIRDPEIWRKTKAAGEKVGGWTVGLLADYAKGLIKLKFDSLLNGASS